MPKDFNLRIYSSVLDPNGPKFQMDLTRHNVGWRRSIRAQGGYWLGSFRQTGDAKGLQAAFERWLGYHVQETSGGAKTWEGMIYEMDLVVNGVRRRRSLDLMSNAVKTTYTKEEYSGDNAVGNFSFEVLGNGGSDVFAGWYENLGTGGAIASVTPGGAVDNGRYIRLTADQDDDPEGMTYVRQNIPVTPGNKYKLTYWTKALDGYAGRIGVNDPNIGSGVDDWVVYPHSTGVRLNAWTQCSDEFVGPSEGDIQVFIMAPLRVETPPGSGTYVYPRADFDYIEMYEYLPGVYETDWQIGEVNATPPPAYSPPYPMDTYGRKEEVIHLDEYSNATSVKYRGTYWKRNAWPWVRPVSAQPPGEATLEVQVCGYVFTANWLYLTEGDGQSHKVGEWISSIVGSEFGLSDAHGGDVDGAGDCQFLKAGWIDPFGANTLTVVETVSLEERPFDRIMELVNLGDQDSAPWHVAVGAGRLLHYAKVDVTPRYFLRNDGVFDTMSGVKPSNPWQMVPGVVKDMTYRSGFNEPGSFLLTNKDIYCEEVEMADGWSRAALKTVLLDESEILKAQLDLAMVEPEGPESPFPPVVPKPPVEDPGWRPPKP